MSNFFKKIFSKQNNNTKKELEAVCPYCKKVLEQRPTRKKKCPFCQNYIYVRTVPSTRKKILATEDEAKKIDEEWQKIGQRQGRLNRLSEVGISEKDFVQRTKKSIEEATEQEIRDVIWSRYNELVAKYMKHNDFGALKSLYYKMALFLNEEGKDWFAVLQQSHKMELLDYKKSGIKKVRILATDNSCEVCRQLHNKVFTIKEALEKMPIPRKECTYKFYTPGDEKGGFCRCMYLAELEE